MGTHLVHPVHPAILLKHEGPAVMTRDGVVASIQQDESSIGDCPHGDSASCPSTTRLRPTGRIGSWTRTRGTRATNGTGASMTWDLDSERSAAKSLQLSLCREGKSSRNQEGGCAIVLHPAIVLKIALSADAGRDVGNFENYGEGLYTSQTRTASWMSRWFWPGFDKVFGLRARKFARPTSPVFAKTPPNFQKRPSSD